MFETLFRCAVATCVATLCWLTPAGAQTTSPAAPLATSAGRIYIVHTTDGDVIAGRGLEMGPDSLRLIVEQQPREWPLASLHHIEAEGDALWNGPLIGGVVLGALCAMMCGQGVDNAAQFGSAIVTNAALGAAIGLLIDASAKGATTIYRADAARPRGARVAFSHRVRF